MKKFKFKLDGLLRLREFKESQAKVEVGRINQKIQKIKDEIVKFENDISTAFKSQEAMAKTGVNAQMMAYYGDFLQANRNWILFKKSELKQLHKVYEEKLTELVKARADHKLIKKMKEEEQKKFKRKMMKKEENEIYEILTIGKGLSRST